MDKPRAYWPCKRASGLSTVYFAGPRVCDSGAFWAQSCRPIASGTRCPRSGECDLRHTWCDDGDAMNRQSAEGAPEWEDAMSKVHSRYSRLARAVIAMFVFAVGMLGGAGVAALLMPT